MKDQEKITPIDQYVIDFIRELRTYKELSQKGLADILRVSKSFISSIESTNSRAKYNLKYINALADYYDMSPKDFLPLKAAPIKFENKDEDKKNKQSSKKTIEKKNKPPKKK